MFRNQNAGRSHSIKMYNAYFERMEDFKFLGTTSTNQHFIQEVNHSTLQSGNVCCHSVKNQLSSSVLTKTIKIEIIRALILSVVLYGYENWSLTLKEEHMLSVFQSKVLTRIFGPKGDEVTRDWRELYNEKLNDLISGRSLYDWQVFNFPKQKFNWHLSKQVNVSYLTLLKQQSIKNTSKLNQRHKVQKLFSFVRSTWLPMVQW